MWSVSLLLCGDSPGCSSHERADTYAQSNLSAVLGRSQERGKLRTLNHGKVRFLQIKPVGEGRLRFCAPAIVLKQPGEALYYRSETALTDTMGDIVSLLIVAAIISAWVFLSRLCLDLLERRTTRGWPTTEAVITGYKLRDADNSEGISSDRWRARLRYRYEVNHTRYWGQMRLTPWNADHVSAENSASALVNKKILVCYQPDRPARSLYHEACNDESAVFVREDGLVTRILWLCF